VFTTDQLAAVFFDSLRAGQQRLRVLSQLGVLERFRALHRTGSESWRYTLGPAGAALVAIERGEDPPRPTAVRAHAARLAAGARTAHTLGVNGLFASLAGHARDHHECELVEWWSERRAGAEWGELVRHDGADPPLGPPPRTPGPRPRPPARRPHRRIQHRQHSGT
jgi:hypothetical protein